MLKKVVGLIYPIIQNFSKTRLNTILSSSVFTSHLVFPTATHERPRKNVLKTLKTLTPTIFHQRTELLFPGA